MSSQVRSHAKSGSILGGVLLITGSCIGAGMLALPVITGVGGFFPSMAFFLLAWAFMTTTALLLLEVNLTLGFNLSLISLAEKTLGRIGKIFCRILFVFLFYCLNVAYIAASGGILKDFFHNLFGFTMPQTLGSVLFTSLFAIVIYAGVKPVDYLNRLLMAGLIIAYFVLVGIGVQHVKSHYLLSHNWKYAFLAMPILVISFGFHNMIPSLCEYFKGDTKRLRRTVLIGSVIPLLIYLLWEVVMLGIIPIEGRCGLQETLNKGEAATSALCAVTGSNWIVTSAQAFALFAIITSFLAQSLSLVDFLSDGLNIPKKNGGRVLLIAITLIPPFFLAFFKPGLFIDALNLAGGFSAVILFGVFPVLMIYKIRKKKFFSLVPILLISTVIFLLELTQLLGLYE